MRGLAPHMVGCSLQPSASSEGEGCMVMLHSALCTRLALFDHGLPGLSSCLWASSNPRGFDWNPSRRGVPGVPGARYASVSPPASGRDGEMPMQLACQIGALRLSARQYWISRTAGSTQWAHSTTAQHHRRLLAGLVTRCAHCMPPAAVIGGGAQGFRRPARPETA